jgi:hypothetical protein
VQAVHLAGASAAAAHGEAATDDGYAIQSAAEPAAASSPAEYLAQVEAHLAALQEQRRGLQGQLSSAAAAAYHALSERLGSSAGTGLPLPAEPAGLIGELAALQAVRQYLQYCQELQALVRHVEKAARGLQQAAAQGGAAPLHELSPAVDAFSSAQGYALAVARLSQEGRVPTQRLRQHAEGLLARVDAAQRSLRALLSVAVQSRLAAARWPPPLAVAGGEGGGGGGVDGGATWRGFAAGGEAAAAELQQLLVVLTTLQRASQHEQFRWGAAAARSLLAEPPLAEEAPQAPAPDLRIQLSACGHPLPFPPTHPSPTRPPAALPARAAP